MDERIELVSIETRPNPGDFGPDGEATSVIARRGTIEKKLLFGPTEFVTTESIREKFDNSEVEPDGRRQAGSGDARVSGHH